MVENVHDKGIVTITSKSVFSDPPVCAPRNVAHLTEDSGFLSKNAQPQWIGWDFRELRVRPTHYTINGDEQSWLVERSLDGEVWTEMDR
jgi:hypothetical protein